MYSEIVHLNLTVSFIGLTESRKIMQVDLVASTVSDSKFIHVF